MVGRSKVGLLNEYPMSKLEEIIIDMTKKSVGYAALHPPYIYVLPRYI